MSNRIQIIEVQDTLKVVFEYHMWDDKMHSVNAFTHNQSEKYLLEAIHQMEKILGTTVSLRLLPYQEGSFKDVLEFGLGTGFITSAFTVLLNHFFSPAPSKTEEEKMLDRMELLQKMKDGKLNDKEVEYLISGDKAMLKACGSYYSTLDKDSDIKSIDCSISKNDEAPKSTQIEKKDFASHIINNKVIRNSYVYKGTTVLITSPVLSKSSKSKWKGVFSGITILFDIHDDLFREQVFNKEIKFEYGTTISCDVTKTTETKFGNSGEIAGEKSSYTVTNITSWEDGAHLQLMTKRYKKQQDDARQLNLFDNDGNPL